MLRCPVWVTTPERPGRSREGLGRGAAPALKLPPSSAPPPYTDLWEGDYEAGWSSLAPAPSIKLGTPFTGMSQRMMEWEEIMSTVGCQAGPTLPCLLSHLSLMTTPAEVKRE